MRQLLGVLALLASTGTTLGQTTIPLEIADGGYLYVRVRVAECRRDVVDGLRDQPFTLDLRAGTLTLESASHLREIASTAAAIPIRLKPNGPFELDCFVQVCIGDSVTAEAEFDTGAGFNMLMLQPEYMRRLGVSPDTKPRGTLEYYVCSTFLPELHYCAAPMVRTEKQFVGFKLHRAFTRRRGHRPE